MSKLKLLYHVCYYILFYFLSSQKSDIQFKNFILYHPQKCEEFQYILSSLNTHVLHVVK